MSGEQLAAQGARLGRDARKFWLPPGHLTCLSHHLRRVWPAGLGPGARSGEALGAAGVALGVAVDQACVVEGTVVGQDRS